MTAILKERRVHEAARAPARGATQRINLRASAAAKEVIERAAASLGTTVSAFMVQSAYDAAQRLVSQQELLSVSAEDFAAFARALARPASPSAALKRLMR